MGKIVRFDTAKAIKDAAARAQARNRDALDMLDRRSSDMAAAYDAQQHNERAQTRQTARPSRTQRRRIAVWNPSGTTIFNIGIAAFAIFWFVPDYLGLLGSPTYAAVDTESASFSFCHEGGGTNCVVDGDTIWYQGNNIRIADIDTPETHTPRCDEEAQLGEEATDRLADLMNAGAFSIQSIDRDTDKYGRQLRVLTRNGESIGGMLVDEGLARKWNGWWRSWC